MEVTPFPALSQHVSVCPHPLSPVSGPQRPCVTASTFPGRSSEDVNIRAANFLATGPEVGRYFWAAKPLEQNVLSRLLALRTRTSLSPATAPVMPTVL